jgi:NAD(P)-dependent dehydrogenase (short-subunit alcohol dehydrogenase family)
MAEDRLLNGKLALVTGASSGSGVDIAQELARAGARVAVHYRSSRAGADTVVATIRAAGAEAHAFQADLSLAGDVRRLVDEVEARLGPVSVLVNNAGPFADTAFRTLTERDWDYVMNANLKSVFLACQRVFPGMERLGWGRIVNLGATSGLLRSHSVYGLAKAALLHLTESMAVEFAPHVTVNAVVPSQIASARTDRMPAYKAAAIAATPLKRLVTQSEIARMVALLCSPAFDFVTGRAIVLDGGRSIPVFPKLNLAAGAEP